MSESNKLLKNTLIYTVGNLGSKILSFLLVPLYSFYLSKTEFGYYDLILTTVSLLVPFLTIQISEASYRWLLDSKNDEGKIKSIVNGSLLVIIISFLCFLVISLILNNIFKIQYTFYFLVLLLLTSFFPYLQQIVRGLGNNKLYSKIGIINTLLVVFFNAIFLLVFKLKLEGVLIATVSANLISIVLIILFGKLYKYISFKDNINVKEIKAMIGYSWPLIPNTISWWLINEVNRFIILFKLGADSNGIFALSNRFPAIMIILSSVFMLSWQDHAIDSHDKENKDVFYSKVFNIYMTLQLTVVIFLISVSRIVVKHFIGPQFFDSWRYMPILYLSVAFSSFAAFLGAGYLGSKKTLGIFATTICGSALNLIFSYLFISKIGLFAPAIGTLLGFAMMWIVRIYQTRHFFTIKINYTVMIFLLLLCGAFMLLTRFDNQYLTVVLIIISIGLSLYFNRTLFLFLIRSVKGFRQKNAKQVDI